MGGIQVTPYRPQSENLLDQVTRLQQLKNAQQQNALQTQGVQGAQLENQQREIDLKSQQAIMKAYSDNNGDLDKTLLQASKNGAKPGDLIKLRQAGIEQQKSNLELLTAKGARALQEADLMQGAHDAVGAAPAEQKPRVYQQQLAGLQQAGVDISKTPPEYPGDQAFALMGAGIKGHKQQLEDLAKQIGIQKDVAQTREATARAGEAEAQTRKVQQETQFGPTGPAAESRYRFILGQMSAGQTPSDADLNFAKSYELANRKTTTSSDTLGVTSTNTSGPSGLASVSRSKLNGGSTPSTAAPGGTAIAQPSAKQSIVDMVGQYKLNPTILQRMMVKHPDVIAAVNQNYPDWDQTTYNAKNKLISGYTSGTQSKEINAINTAMGHIGVLDGAVDALNNGDVRVLNSIANRLGIEVGQTPQATFKLIVHRVGPEISSAYVPGGGGQAERFANEEDFNENLAPGILHANAAISVKLLRSKVGSLENQYKNTVSRDDFQQKFISLEAQKAFDKFASQGGSGSTAKFQVGQTVSIRGNKMKITAVHPDGSFDAQ